MAKLSRERILAAARTALVDGGHEKIALRPLARELGVTAPALYDHFDSKDALLRSVAADGFGALIQALDVAGETPLERIRTRALAYVAFAAGNPELFRLMFMFRPAAVEVVNRAGAPMDNELPAADAAFEKAAADVVLAVSAGEIAARETTELATLLWATMHGVGLLAVTAPQLASGLAEDVIDTMLAGLRPS